MDFEMDMPLFGALTEPDELDVSVNPMVIREPQAKRPIGKRIFKDLKRKESAAQAVAELERDGMEIFGLTRGQFSLADMIEAIVKKTGPVEMVISTWTAATTDASQMQALLRSGLITDCKWLVDISLVRRKPELASQVREQFGPDAIRVMQTHAKFVIIRNAEWQVVIRSSMNLNQNPRLESFQVGHDPEMATWLQRVVDDVWKRQPRALSEGSVSNMFAWWAKETGMAADASLSDEGTPPPKAPEAPEAPEAIVTVGVPGCGKSTWARDRAAETGATVIELDEARRVVNGDAADQSNMAQVLRQRNKWLSDAATARRPVIIADTNLHEGLRAKLIERLQKLGYRVVIKVFDTPHDVSRARNAARDRVVPDDIMARFILEFETQRDALGVEV